MSPTQQRRGRLLRPTIAVDAVFAAVAAVVLLKDLTLGRFGPRQHPQEVRRRRDLLLERPYRCNKWSGPERDGRTSHDGHWTEIAIDYRQGQYRCAKCHADTHPQERRSCSSAVLPRNAFTVICGLSKDETINGTQDESTNHSCRSQGVNWQFRLGLLKLLCVDAVVEGHLPQSSGNMRLKLMKAEH